MLPLAPRALARTFTLREAAHLLALLGDDLEPAADGPAERARNLVTTMTQQRERMAARDGIALICMCPADVLTGVSRSREGGRGQ
jgi:hypothetical protein